MPEDAQSKAPVLFRPEHISCVSMRLQEGENMKLILCIIASEALTQLVCKAEIFDTPREFIKSLSDFTRRLLDCPYCVSVWVSGFTVCLYCFYEYTWVFVLLLVIHRASNFIHDLFRIVQNYKIDQVLGRK